MHRTVQDPVEATSGPRSDWRCPAPRGGWRGAWDRFVGPGATRAEQLLSGLLATLAALAVSVYAAVNDLGWLWYQHLVAIIIMFDLMGGVVTNATPSAKRWYHREGQGPREHFRFVAGHAVQVALIAFVFLGTGGITYFLGVYGYVLIAAAATMLVPIELQRGLALASVCGAVMIADWLLTPVAGLEWFLPVLTVKLVVSHSTLEEPYFSAR